MASRERDLEVERSAERWRGNSKMWSKWNSQLLWSEFKVTWAMRFVGVWDYMARKDDGYNHSQLAWAFNLCFIIAGVILLLACFIFHW